MHLEREENKDALIAELVKALGDCVVTLNEAASICRPNLPNFAKILDMAADRGRTAIHKAKP